MRRATRSSTPGTAVSTYRRSSPKSRGSPGPAGTGWWTCPARAARLAHRYLCIWETDADDPASVAAGLQAAIQAGKIDMTPAMDVTASPPVSQWFEPVEG